MRRDPALFAENNTDIFSLPPNPCFILSFHSEDIQLFVPKSADTSANRGLIRPNVIPHNICLVLERLSKAAMEAIPLAVWLQSLLRVAGGLRFGLSRIANFGSRNRKASRNCRMEARYGMSSAVPSLPLFNHIVVSLMNAGTHDLLLYPIEAFRKLFLVIRS